MIILKLLAGILVLLILIVGFATFNYYHTSAIADDLQDSLSGIKQHLEKENWEQAHNEINELNINWEKADRWWTPFMDHREIDMLDQSIGRVSSLVEVRLREEALVEIQTAKRMIQRIMDREGVNLSNIF